MRLTKDGPALLLLNVVTSSIRNCLWPSSRLHGLQLFLNLSPNLMDEDKVDRIVPFVVELLSDEVAIVRAEACRTLVTVVRGLPSLPAGLTHHTERSGRICVIHHTAELDLYPRVSSAADAPPVDGPGRLRSSNVCARTGPPRRRGGPHARDVASCKGAQVGDRGIWYRRGESAGSQAVAVGR